MRYAIIDADTNLWHDESDDLEDIKTMLAEQRNAGKNVILVEVLVGEDDKLESVPDLFEDISR